ncbi:MAG: hypothetical protein IJL71_03945 [Oscillospiraceae bacterium]|nr:hypothetical protein [Oscillospiraceae bacterium]
MKRTLASILVCVFFVAILFAGCKQNTKATNTTETELSQEIPTAKEDTSPQETTATVEITEPAPSASIRNPATYRPQDRGKNFLETDSYYYYLNNGLIYFSEKTAPSFYLLCSKPNCSHDGEDCNAYGGGEGSALGYWDGKLYTAGWLNNELALVRMDMDGSNHELVATMEVPLDSKGQQGGSYTFVFALGSLYYFVDAQSQSVFQVELSTGKTERLFKDLLADESAIPYDLRFDEDYMYFTLNHNDGSRTLYRSSPDGMDAQPIWDWPENVWEWGLSDRVLYYYNRDDGTFYEYDIEAETLTAKATVQLGLGSAYYDTDYIYLVTTEYIGSGYNEFYTYDRDYNLLQHISLPHSGDYLYAAGDKLFFSNTYSYKIAYYLPFFEIGSEDAELHKVTDPYALR